MLFIKRVKMKVIYRVGFIIQLCFSFLGISVPSWAKESVDRIKPVIQKDFSSHELKQIGKLKAGEVAGQNKGIKDDKGKKKMGPQQAKKKKVAPKGKSPQQARKKGPQQAAKKGPQSDR